MSDGVTLTHTCGYCGAKHEQTAAPRHTNISKLLPEGWSFDQYAGQSPRWFTDDGQPEPPPAPAVFCSEKCKDTFKKLRTEIDYEAQREGTALSCALYRERIAAMMLEGRGAVVALGEIATKAEADKKTRKKRGKSGS